MSGGKIEPLIAAYVDAVRRDMAVSLGRLAELVKNDIQRIDQNVAALNLRLSGVDDRLKKLEQRVLMVAGNGGGTPFPEQSDRT